MTLAPADNVELILVVIMPNSVYQAFICSLVQLPYFIIIIAQLPYHRTVTVLHFMRCYIAIYEASTDNVELILVVIMANSAYQAFISHPHKLQIPKDEVTPCTSMSIQLCALYTN